MFCFALPVTLPGAIAGSAADIFDIRLGVNEAGRTRIVLDMTDAAPYRVTTHREGDEDQIILSLDTAHMMIGADASGTGRKKGIGYVSQYEFADGATPRRGRDVSPQGGAQVVFSLKTLSVPGSVILLEPRGETSHYRLVIDLVTADRPQFNALAGQSTELPVSGRPSSDQPTKRDGQSAGTVTDLIGTREQVTTAARSAAIDVGAGTTQEAPFQVDSDAARRIALDLARRAAEIESSRQMQQFAADRLPLPRVKPSRSTFAQKSTPVIVIDPGHGGRHPGAVGPTGLVEKTVTLAAAKSLQVKLIKMGYQVVLTREDDSYLDLEDRIDHAKKMHADLFLSIHADANENPELRGASVYTLSENGSARLARQFRSHGNFALFDKQIAPKDSDVSEILFDLAHTDTKNQSARFSAILIDKLGRKIPMLNNTHRHAGYAVLLSPDIPAVLLELAFISNKLDEKNLKSENWRNMAIEAVAQSIDTYFNPGSIYSQPLDKEVRNTPSNILAPAAQPTTATFHIN